MAQDNQPYIPLELPKESPTKFIADSIKTKAPSDAMYKSYQIGTGADLFTSANKNSKISTKLYNVKASDAYTTLGSGESIAKFDVFHSGVNNENLYAQQQTTGDKWINGLYKLGGKTGTAILGGTIGVLDSAFTGITQGSLSAAYNSDFNKWLDDLNTKMDYKLPNYYTEQERQNSFGQNVSSANFWADQVLGGLSFTVGAVVSEGIWAWATGGTSLLTSAERWGVKALGASKSMKSLNAWKSLAPKQLMTGASKEALETTISSGLKTHNAFKMAETGRFLLTSAGYEAGVEARHFMKESEEEWLRGLGRTPTQEERFAFYDNLTSSANTVFATNLALVGSSNLATFGKLALGKSIKPTMSNSWFNKNILGLGYKEGAEKGVFEAVKATTKQKVAREVYGLGKHGFVEGIYEEGLQAVTSDATKNYLLKGYDEKGLRTSYGAMEAIYDGLSNTYGTKQGWNELGVGIIVGMLGGGTTSKLTTGTFSGYDSKNIEKQVALRNQFHAGMVIERLKANTRIEEATKKAEQASKTNDITGEIASNKEAEIASIERDYNFQGIDKGINDFVDTINTLDTEDLAKELELSIEETQIWKEDKIESYKTTAKEYERNMRYAEALLGDSEIAGLSNKDALSRAIAFNLTMGKSMDLHAQNTSDTIKSLLTSDLVGRDVVNVIDVDNTLDNVDRQTKADLQKLTAEQKRLLKNKTDLENKIVDIDNIQDREDNSAKVEQRKSAVRKLLDVETKLTETNQKRETVLNLLNLQNKSGRLLSLEDLDNQSQNLEKLKGHLQTIKLNDPQKHALITKLMLEHNKAVRYTKSFNKTTREIIDPNTRVTLLNDWLSSLLKKNKGKVDEDFFADSILSYSSQGIETLMPETEKAIQENEYNKFKNGVPVSVEYLKELEKSVKAGTPLSETDQEIYNANKEIAEEEGLTTLAPVSSEESIESKNILSPIEAIDKKIKDILEDKYLLDYFGEELDAKKPTEADLEEYQRLKDSILFGQEQNVIDTPTEDLGDIGLTKTEIERFKELNKQLNDWKYLDGSVLNPEDNSIADLISLRDKMQQQAEQKQTKTQVKEEEYFNVKNAEETQPLSIIETSSTITSPDNVVVFIKANEKDEAEYNFSHINIETFARLLNGQLDSTENTKKQGKKFTISTPNGIINVTIGERARLVVNKKQLDDIIVDSNIRIYNTGLSNNNAVFEKTQDGTFIPLLGDFGYSNINNEQVYINLGVLNSIKKDDELRTELDLNDSWNAQKISEYKAIKNPTQEDLEKFQRELQIYIKPKNSNELVGAFRAIRVGEKLKPTQGVEKNMALRKKAVEIALSESNTKTVIDLDTFLDVKMNLLGTPNIEVSEKENGNLQATVIPFTQQAIQKVKAKGYILDGEAVLDNKLPQTNETLVKKLSNNNPGQKIPVIVFESNGQNILYPIDINKSRIDKTSELDFLVSNDIANSEKANRILDVMLNNGLNPSDYPIDFTQNDWWIENESIDKLYTSLENIEEYISAEDLANKDFLKENLIREAKISIDLENQPLRAGKIVVEISEVKPYDDVIGFEEQFTTAENNWLNSIDELSNLADEIYSYYNNNINKFVTAKGQYIEDNVFIEALDEIQEAKDLKTPYISKVKKINAIKKAFTFKKSINMYSTDNKIINKALGEQILNKVTNRINNYETASKKKEVYYTSLKNSKLKKEVKENLQNPC